MAPEKISSNFITSKLLAIWPNVDVSKGSAIDTTIVQPLLVLFEDFDTEDFESFLSNLRHA